MAVLQWGVRPWLEREPDPLQRVIDEARPAWLRGLRRLGGFVLKSYLLTLIVWLAIAPLAAAHYHLVSPIGVLLGPPLVAADRPPPWSPASCCWPRPRSARR